MQRYTFPLRFPQEQGTETIFNGSWEFREPVACIVTKVYRYSDILMEKSKRTSSVNGREMTVVGTLSGILGLALDLLFNETVNRQFTE